MDDPQRRRSEDPVQSRVPRGLERLRLGPPLALFLAALAVRALPWRSHLEAGRVHFHDSDAYYHARRILYGVVRFPEFLSFDPYLNFPHGGEPIWSPLFDFAAALLARACGATEVAALERFLVWIPPVLGAATVVVVYFAARAHFGRDAAWLAGGLLAILPAHFLYSRIGFVDHHVAVALVEAALLWSGMSLVRDCARSPVPVRPALRLALGSGALVGIALLLWPGMILDVGLLDAGFVVLLASRARPAEARALGLLLALAHALAALLVTPLAWGRSWRVWGSFTPVVLSSFQPWYLAAAAACFALVAVGVRGGDARVPLARRLGILLVSGLVVLGASALWIDVRAPWQDAWQWFAKQEAFQATVNESRPLLFQRGRFDLSLAIASFSLLFFLIPVGLGVAARRIRRGESRAAGALLLGWAAAFLGASLMQIRFTSSFAIPFALLAGWCAPRLLRRLAARAGGGRLGRAAVGVSLVVLLAPALGSYAGHLGDLARGLRGAPAELGPLEQRRRTLVEVADWLRENTPPTSGYLDAGVRPEYAVLSHWTDGHVLEYAARRPTVVDNFGDDLGEENLALAEEYYRVEEPRASAILDALGARYVIFEFRPYASRSKVDPRSLLSRLYFGDGAESPRSVAVTGTRARQVEVPVPAVVRHRLVYESQPRTEKRAGRRPAFKVYEHVRGALLVGEAEPGAPVEARLAIETNRGRRFEFLSTVRADAQGRFALRFPYPTRGTPPGVRSADRVELRGPGGAARVSVREQDVREGRVLTVPAFARE